MFGDVAYEHPSPKLESMNTCLRLLVFALYLISGADAFASDEASSLAALHGAQALSQINAPGDFARAFPADSRYRKQIELELAARDHSEFIKPAVTMPTEQTVELKFPDRVVSLDYSRLEKQVLLVNGKPVKLEAFKTILNYKSEADAILSQKNFGFSVRLFSTADASSRLTKTLDWISYYTSVGNALATPSSLGPSRDGNLAADIIRAYRNQVGDYPGVTPDQFTCAGGHLSTMRSGVHEPGLPQQVLRRTETGYTYNLGTLIIDMDGDFKITHSSYPEITRGADFTHVRPFFRFPRSAEKCCVLSRCYAEVSRGLKALLDETARTQRAQGVR